ncbi:MULTISPECIES: hypothetical protein [Paenibacillus]|uniref:Gliding motility protein n=1 Tax=Paenibacillus pabuli TaxID=1472 RepID=A0A855YEE9_9BACL|nr:MULTISPECIES: hypothetical protein [Paenibacillus]PWW43909.1 hypothetical protein DET56_102138 [Paenibacillus pabuli]PXW09938.1 hypothetical protein DEU73_102138 [Paenibacillus taichungensis]RAI89713.1 hypothetical protein DET54_114182 [Paenibacillus pabuli]
MVPTVGDIYCVYVENLQQYAACQVTGLKETGSKGSRQLAAVLQLDWTGDQRPDETELHQMKPLICSFYFWKNRLDHTFVNANVPSNYILAGNIPPLVTEQTNSYSGGWLIGDSLYRQRQWDAIDETRRIRFKKAAADFEEISVGHQMMRRNSSVIRNFKPRSEEDVAELAKLPCLTNIQMDGYSESLIPFLTKEPIINELHITNHGQKSLDLSKSHLTKLVIDVSGLERLTLNTKMKSLNFTGNLPVGLCIDAHEDGKWLTLNVAASLPHINGVPRLDGLHIREITELDLAHLVKRYPELTELRLWGKPGSLIHLESIQHLKALQEFSTYDLFGFIGEQFPNPEQFPKLSKLWLTSLPAEAAKSIKTRYKKAAAAGLELEISKPRKPEWLAENLTNPFRDWDGRDHIKSAHAKKAAQLYKQCLKEIRQLAQSQISNEAIQKQLFSMVENYTQTFNKMDAKTGFIETVEREEIHVVLASLLDQLEQELGNESTIKVSHEALYEVFDQLRDF